MFKNVLVGVDGSINGRDAIALATRLVEPDGKLTLANVHAGEFHPLNVITPGLLESEQKASEELLRSERAETGVEHAELLNVVAPSPGAGLHAEAERLGADLLVVGSCGRGAFGRVMLGDDTRAALNGASCAVAIAARGYFEHPTPIANVGVAYNGSPESKAALAKAREVAAPTHATVHALEVVSIPSYAYSGLVAPNLGDSIDTLLDDAKQRLGALEGVDGRAVYGLPGEELAAFGGEVDVLVVGSRSYGPLRRLVVGSTSDFLQRHARCSLLVLPRAATEDAPAAS